jgi:hypothetical protein
MILHKLAGRNMERKKKEINKIVGSKSKETVIN